MRIVYVTSALPYGSREPFLIPEIVELSRQGHDLTIVPMRPQGAVIHDDIRPFLPSSVGLPLMCREILASACVEAVSSPGRTLRALCILFRSRNLRIFAKNIAVFPKGLWLGRQVRRVGADHLHAHWAATSATMALVAAETSGVPWSFTAHRWDIPEDNLLALKTARACFVRTISARGARALSAGLSAPAAKIRVLHVGINVAESASPLRWEGRSDRLEVVVIADLIEVKGHRKLLDALEIIEARGPLVHVDLAGDGSLRIELERWVRRAGLSHAVTFLGTVPHSRLLDDMRRRRWDAAVLPSLVTDDADEGIPVSLMEAMAAGLPVISTRTGAIPELVGDGAGILVEGGDPHGLAEALEELARNSELRERLSTRGRERVLKAFNVTDVVAVLAQHCAECTVGRDRTSRNA